MNWLFLKNCSRFPLSIVPPSETFRSVYINQTYPNVRRARAYHPLIYSPRLDVTTKHVPYSLSLRLSCINSSSQCSTVFLLACFYCIIEIFTTQSSEEMFHLSQMLFLEIWRSTRGQHEQSARYLVPVKECVSVGDCPFTNPANGHKMPIFKFCIYYGYRYIHKEHSNVPNWTNGGKQVR